LSIKDEEENIFGCI